MNQLRDKGFLFWDTLLALNKVENIRRFLATKPVFNIHDLQKKPLELSAVKSDQPLKLNYFPADIVQSEDIVRLANDERLISIVSIYVGCKP